MSTNASGTTDKAKAAASEAATQGQEVAQNAAATAKDVAGNAKSSAAEVTGQAKEQASQLTSQATDQIRSIASNTGSQLQEHASTQTGKAAEATKTLSQQMKALAEGRVDEAGPATQYIQQASDKLATFADRLETGGPSGIADDVSTFARQRPGVFLLGAAAVGFGLGRLLRGTQAAHQSESSSQGQSPAVDLTATPQAYESEHAYGSNIIGGR